MHVHDLHARPYIRQEWSAPCLQLPSKSSHVVVLLLLPVQARVGNVGDLVTFKPTHIYSAAEDIFLREPCFSWPGVKLDAEATGVPKNMEAVQRLKVRYCGPYNRPLNYVAVLCGFAGI